jgi:hypothetical protein
MVTAAASIATNLAAVCSTASTLIEQVNRLRAQHRAEITPTFGQLENLFDTAAILERQLDQNFGETLGSPPRRACSAVELCEATGEHELVPGRFYCTAHARQVRRVLGNLTPDGARA